MSVGWGRFQNALMCLWKNTINIIILLNKNLNINIEYI